MEISGRLGSIGIRRCVPLAVKLVSLRRTVRAGDHAKPFGAMRMQFRDRAPDRDRLKERIAREKAKRIRRTKQRAPALERGRLLENRKSGIVFGQVRIPALGVDFQRCRILGDETNAAIYNRVLLIAFAGILLKVSARPDGLPDLSAGNVRAEAEALPSTRGARREQIKDAHTLPYPQAARARANHQFSHGPDKSIKPVRRCSVCHAVHGEPAHLIFKRGECPDMVSPALLV